MLYIHQLNHLTPKMADLESVYLIRELKERTPYPLKEEKLEETFCEFFISPTELQAIEESLQLIEPTAELVKALLQKQSPLHEAINLQRAVQMLASLPQHIQNNLQFLQEFQVWQSTSHRDVAGLFNRIPQLRSIEEKIKANHEVNALFAFLLRNKEFFFNHQDLVNEGQVSTANGLVESMQKGFFFHVTLEEEMKKLDYSAIRLRIPPAELEEAAVVERNIQQIKKGIDIAYKANMRIVNLSVVLYSYVKWLTAK